MTDITSKLTEAAHAGVTAPARRKSMFFEKVGGSKEIPFKTTLFLYKKLNGVDYFTTGSLVSKTQTAEGFQYLFFDIRIRLLWMRRNSNTGYYR